MSELTDKAAAKIADARKTAEEKVAEANAKATEVAAKAREKAEAARVAAREKAKIASSRTKSGIENNPIVALAGGLAIGAIAAFLLPRTEREDRVAGTIGKKVRETASTAAKAAQSTGKDQLDAMGLNADAARDQVKDLFGKLAKAATSAASAAGESIKKR
jgi:ElaB/YqjD/DUF883 family membrane-anchored ribosome-binding protein